MFSLQRDVMTIYKFKVDWIEDTVACKLSNARIGHYDTNYKSNDHEAHRLTIVHLCVTDVNI